MGYEIYKLMDNGEFTGCYTILSTIAMYYLGVFDETRLIKKINDMGLIGFDITNPEHVTEIDYRDYNKSIELFNQ